MITNCNELQKHSTFLKINNKVISETNEANTKMIIYKLQGTILTKVGKRINFIYKIKCFVALKIL